MGPKFVSLFAHVTDLGFLGLANVSIGVEVRAHHSRLTRCDFISGILCINKQLRMQTKS